MVNEAHFAPKQSSRSFSSFPATGAANGKTEGSEQETSDGWLRNRGSDHEIIHGIKEAVGGDSDGEGCEWDLGDISPESSDGAGSVGVRGAIAQGDRDRTGNKNVVGIGHEEISPHGINITDGEGQRHGGCRIVIADEVPGIINRSGADTDGVAKATEEIGGWIGAGKGLRVCTVSEGAEESGLVRKNGRCTACTCGENAKQGGETKGNGFHRKSNSTKTPKFRS